MSTVCFLLFAVWSMSGCPAFLYMSAPMSFSVSVAVSVSHSLSVMVVILQPVLMTVSGVCVIKSVSIRLSLCVHRVPCVCLCLSETFLDLFLSVTVNQSDRRPFLDTFSQ